MVAVVLRRLARQEALTRRCDEGVPPVAQDDACPWENNRRAGLSNDGMGWAADACQCARGAGRGGGTVVAHDAPAQLVGTAFNPEHEHGAARPGGAADPPVAESRRAQCQCTYYRYQECPAGDKDPRQQTPRVLAHRRRSRARRPLRSNPSAGEGPLPASRARAASAQGTFCDPSCAAAGPGPRESASACPARESTSGGGTRCCYWYHFELTPQGAGLS